MKYWINENGNEHPTTKKLYSLWIKEFCRQVTTMEGRTIEKPFPAIKDIYCGYNGFGVKICGVIES